MLAFVGTIDGDATPTQFTLRMLFPPLGNFVNPGSFLTREIVGTVKQNAWHIEWMGVEG